MFWPCLTFPKPSHNFFVQFDGWTRWNRLRFRIPSCRRKFLIRLTLYHIHSHTQWPAALSVHRPLQAVTLPAFGCYLRYSTYWRKSTYSRCWTIYAFLRLHNSDVKLICKKMNILLTTLFVASHLLPSLLITMKICRLLLDTKTIRLCLLYCWHLEINRP